MHHSQYRLTSLDIIKSLAIYLVILLHYCFYTPNFVKPTHANLDLVVLTECGVPLFLMVNGYLLFHAHFSYKKHKDRIIRTIIVLLLWKIVSLPIVSILDNHQPIDWHRIPGFLLGIDWTGGAPLGYFWFMNALVAIYLIFPVLKLAYDNTNGRKYLIWLTLVLICLVFVANDANSLIGAINFYHHRSTLSPFTSLQEYNIFGQYSSSLLFFMLGGLSDELFSLLHKIGHNNRKVEISVLFIVFALSWFIANFLARYQRESGIRAVWGIQNAYQTTAILLMTICVFLLFTHITSFPQSINKLTEIGGRNTLGVYYLHLMLIFSARNIIAKLAIPIPMPVNLLVVFVLFCVGTAISQTLRSIPIVGVLFGGAFITRTPHQETSKEERG